MGNLKTPLLRPLRKAGLTLYTFPSAMEDISLNFNTGTQGVGMSHYALLNLTKNNFAFDDSTAIVKSLQNYLMNVETLLLNQKMYNYQEPQTVSEHVFWKWLMDNSNSHFTVSSVVDNSDIYREANYSVSNKDRVVQCFGVIDSGNHLSTDFGMFNETYVNIPTSYGNGPVFFRKAEDNENYKKNISYKTGTYIEGRTASDKTYLSGTNALKPLITEYKDAYALEIIKDVPSLDRACKTVFGSTVNISSIDDMNVDFASQFNRNAEYSINTGKDEFKFNAVLLYYSVYDLNDVNKDPVATNLFGILFLDGGQTVLDNDYFISPTTKRKSYKSTQSGESYFGNGYSFRVNIKTLSVYDNTDAVIQDNTTSVSSYAQDFNDVIANLNRAIDIMNVNMRVTSGIQDAYMAMKSEFVNLRSEFNALANDIKSSNEDMINAKIEAFTERLDYAINGIRAELGLDEEDTYDDAVVSAPAVPKPKVISSALLNHLVGSVKRVNPVVSSSGQESVNTGTIADARINVISASDANINAADDVNITGKEIFLNFKDKERVAKVAVSGIISRLAMLEQTLNDFAVNALSDNPVAPVEKPMSVEQIIALGVVPISGILPPRAKKPESAGFYLKTNTSGNIVQYVCFDGDDYTDTVKCEQGILYSVRGKLYTFNGETCVLLGA